MQTLKDVKVGDTVFVIHGYRRMDPSPVEVVKVGRTLLHVKEFSRIDTYRIEDGIDSKHYAGTPSCVKTQDMIDYDTERAVLQDRLKVLGVGPTRNYGGLSYDNDGLKKIIAVIEELEREKKTNGR